ncbi:hypothetical protein Tco_0707749, partial [Tanacetum coccineum]
FMAAPVISISSDSSEERVGSHVLRVILFGAIPAIIPVIPEVLAEVPIVPADLIVTLEVGAVSVISLTGVLDLVDYSSSDSDPLEDSLPSAPDLPLSGSSSSDTLTPSFEFLVAHMVIPPGIRRQPAILIRPREAIPFGRPYRTHPNGPHRLMTARKRVGPFPARKIAWRCVPHCSSDCHSLQDSSSSHSSSDSSSDTSSGSSSDSLSDASLVHSLGYDTSSEAHSGPSTRVASSRLVYPLVRTP